MLSVYAIFLYNLLQGEAANGCYRSFVDYDWDVKPQHTNRSFVLSSKLDEIQNIVVNVANDPMSLRNPLEIFRC